MSLIQKLKKDKDVQEFLYAKDVDFETNFINTGSVAMNLLMSGRIDGGIPMYKVAMHASSSAEGKCHRWNQRLIIEVSDEVYQKYFNGFECLPSM